MKLILRGHIPGKKNMLRRSKNGGLYRDKSVVKQIDLLVLQARAQWIGKEPIDNALIVIEFTCRDQRADLDNKTTTILDVLQSAKILRSDNLKHLREFHVIGGTGPEETCTIWVVENK